ncbi:hypothetical protein CAURIC_03285 [Corynebacterium auriscanis]|nr:hypothetical protein CAURIC_03285 [Corynebacterium auriscanis]
MLHSPPDPSRDFVGLLLHIRFHRENTGAVLRTKTPALVRSGALRHCFARENTGTEAFGSASYPLTNYLVSNNRTWGTGNLTCGTGKLTWGTDNLYSDGSHQRALSNQSSRFHCI